MLHHFLLLSLYQLRGMGMAKLLRSSGSYFACVYSYNAIFSQNIAFGFRVIEWSMVDMIRKENNIYQSHNA